MHCRGVFLCFLEYAVIGVVGASRFVARSVVGHTPVECLSPQYTESVTVEGAAFLIHVNGASWQRFLEGGLVAWCFDIVQRKSRR